MPSISLEEHVARALRSIASPDDCLDLARAAIAAVREHEPIPLEDIARSENHFATNWRLGNLFAAYGGRDRRGMYHRPGWTRICEANRRSLGLAPKSAPDPAEAMRAKCSNRFAEQDYSDLAERIRMDADKPYLPAILSNNFNVILGALDTAAALKGNGEGE